MTTRKGLEHRLTVYENFDKEIRLSWRAGRWDFENRGTTRRLIQRRAHRYDGKAIVDVIFEWGPKTMSRRSAIGILCPGA